MEICLKNRCANGKHQDQKNNPPATNMLLCLKITNGLRDNPRFMGFSRHLIWF